MEDKCKTCPFHQCCPFVGREPVKKEIFKKHEDKQVFIMPSNVRSEILNG